jgi:hypothetical protein
VRPFWKQEVLEGSDEEEREEDSKPQDQNPYHYRVVSK